MHFNKKKLSEICAATLIAGGAAATIAPGIAMAATAAGTLIKNLATVTYEDANGNEYSAQSNEAVITVKQVFSAELSEDKATTAAAGQTTYIQHTLTNTGNGSDTYTLASTSDAGNPAGTNVQMYLDSNGNGLADAGEPLIAENGTVTLEAGESAEIVMAVAVPNTATDGDTLNVTLTATAATGTVTDTGANGDGDTVDNSATNDDVITVSADAVLNYTKSAILNEADSSITYTLTITNTGNRAATDVVISDNLPKGMMPHATMTPTASGILTSNAGDVLPAFTTNTGSISEATDDTDYNNNGIKTDTLDGYTVTATDASIAPGQTISITFTADYDPLAFNNDDIAGSANDIARNVASLTADLDGDGTPEAPIESNPTQTTLPAIYGISTDDTGAGSSPGVNDGGDDDASLNDIQTVDTAPDGSTVEFPVVLTNNGSGPDTFDLSVLNGDFPPGTTFTFWNADGTVPLVDTNGEAGPDTGVLDSGESVTVMVKANLPSNPTTDNMLDGGDGYSATVTGTSSEDPSATPVTDDAQLLLQNIIAATVDLRDTLITPDANAAVNDDALNVPGSTVDANGYNTDGYAIVSGADVYDGTDGATVGGTVNIPFHIDNNSGSSDAFQLTVGSSLAGGVVGPLPDGWAANFYKADASGNPTGQPLTSTELLAPNTIGDATTNHYVAVVQIPNDPAKAPANYIADNDGDVELEMMDANSDGDGDQPIFIQITSANSGSSDVMVDAIDVDPIRDITLTPPGANQIQPGGSVDYNHTLDNTGNTDEQLELTASNSLNPEGWNNSIAVPVDHDNDPNTPPINKPLSQLQPGDLVEGTDTDGNPITMPVTDDDTDGNPEITLPAGVEVPLTPTVFAPSDAAPGTIDTLTINATSPDTNGPTATVEDVSEVVVGQVRLTKTVAHDADCDGVEDSVGSYMPNLTTEIPPGDCAVWQIVAENQGDAPARNVVIHDEVTAFTTYADNTLSYSLANGTAASIADDGTSANAAAVTGDAVTFYVGSGADSSNGLGGELLPGQFATVRFSTKID